MKTARRLTVCFMLLWYFAGSMMAQTDSPYVLKRKTQINGTDHYLTHVNNGGTWVLQDATSFDPATCIWYSGPKFNVSGNHHNYYFYDGANYRFLSAPLEGHGVLDLSATLPTSSHLKNPDEVYYFYDWDQDPYGGGVARGHEDNTWWTVHWVAYSGFYNEWTTTEHAYHITDSSAMYRTVTITEHDKAFNWTANPGGTLSNFSMDYDSDIANNGHGLSIAINSYSYTCTPAYITYNFEGTDHNYQGTTSLGTSTPTPSAAITGTTASSYSWEVSGPGAEFLSFTPTANSNDTTATGDSPILYYTKENKQGHKTAKLTLTMTFGSGETMATEVREATITVNTTCQNPAQAVTPMVNHNDVTVTWYPTATRYKVEWKKASENWNNARSAEVGNVTSYIITDLEQVAYHYRVIAYCGSDYLDPPTNATGSFMPEEASDLMIYGSIYGGGRMADVTGNTEVVIVNCDSIGAIFGGNDIAGTVGSTGVDDGSIITLGTNATTSLMKIGSVYGGGNGYYAYNGTSFAEASNTYNSQSVGVTDSISAMTATGQVGESVWTNNGTTATTWTFPSIKKTNITVGSDYVKIDSLFGGAKNAFITKATADNTTITINGGTVFAVFGGNNIGGTLGDATQKITVTNTTTDLNLTTGPVGLGRTHGIGYLFGGGNKVAAYDTDITITGGQLDTIFGGGNRESVHSADLTVNCTTNRISGALNGDVISDNYGWDGNSVYNVHTLFGGNNRAHMNGVPHITLASGGVGTAYGGGNAGDMLAHNLATLDDTEVNYGTHMVLEEESPIIVDFLYGGCQMSNVAYSTWVEIKGGHVGTVYGGCNVSGDVGSTRTQPDEPAFTGEEPNQEANLLYQEVQGATYVKVTGGTVHRDVFAGSNGYYHCNDGIRYVYGLNFGDPDGSPAEYDPDSLYLGLTVPTHNETNVKIWGGHIKGNVYAGGNLACVGFTDYTVPPEHTTGDKLFPTFVGMAFVQMQGGEVDGDVYGGGRMASVFGSNSVNVMGGIIHGALYGGNDRTGQVAQITNRVLTDFDKASDGITDLNQLNVKSYVKVTGNPEVGTVYGGGNGDYNYTGVGDDAIQFCGITPDEPIQSNTFVDINIDGGDDGGKIGTVYGGGNGVTVIGGITVLLNVQGNPDNYAGENVNFIYGGNNKGSLTFVPDIILMNGNVDTVYGGCNQGAMYGDHTVKISNDLQYEHVGSLVRLRDVYTFVKKNDDNSTTSITHPVNSRVLGAVYGGCRMNGVTNNSMVLVEGHDHGVNSTFNTSTEIFGGSDISGNIGGTSQVVIFNGTNPTTVGNVYAGGNGNYIYQNNNVYTIDNRLIAQGTAQNPIVAPSCANTLVDLWSGTAKNLYGGGYAAGVTGNTAVNFNGGAVSNGIYGGCYSKGTMGNIAVNVLSNLGADGTPMIDGIFGGGYGAETRTNGNVIVTIDKPSGAGATAPVVYADVYGGSALGWVNDDLNDLTKVDFKNGTLHGNIFGGGMGQVGNNAIAAKVNGDVLVNINNGTLYNSIYGGCNLNGVVNGDIELNISGGNIGINTATADIFGGGYGHYTTTNGNVTVTVTKASGTGAPAAPVIYGDVYGGSGYGDVNTPAESVTETDPADITTVNILEGTINGDIYGGGLGQKQIGDDPTTAYPAHVNGIVYVNIGDGQVNSTTGFATSVSGNATIEGDVYGCNNLNGTPLDSVFVNIYQTAHGLTPQTNHYPGNPPSGHSEWTPEALLANTALPQDYAINAVYGGGNRAAYIPLLNTDGTAKSAKVHVYTCLNTIKDVYGGGNAADVGVDGADGTLANTMVIVDGGRIENVFGGGNGKSTETFTNPGANIYGTATSYVYAGLINQVYGGANMKGSINVIDLHLPGSEGCDEVFGSVFGCANAAPLNHSITTTVRCGVGTIGELYGGSNQAYIGIDDGNNQATVTLNLYGGVYNEVFGGSKGISGGAEAPIYGNVVLNLYGGTITDAYGGCDKNGNVTGRIIVNVLDYEDNECPLDVTNIYGASNQTPYTPTYTVSEGSLRESPIVNVIHINNAEGTGQSQVIHGVRGNVYGGGNLAEATSCPVVNIGYDANTVLYSTTDGTTTTDITMANVIPSDYPQASQLHNYPQAFVTRDVFGGGNEAVVEGTATVNLRHSHSRVNNLFGGGNQAGTTNSVVNVYDGTVATAVYGGCNSGGTVTGDINVNILNNLGATGDNAYNVNVYGGGLGMLTNTTGDITVTIGGQNTTPILYGTVYGGSALGSVNAADKLTRVWLKSGTIHGNVFGGGLGRVADSQATPPVTAVAAHVNGDIQVVGDGSTVDGWIFGANDQNGDPEGTVTVTLNSGQVTNVVGGGNVAAYSAPLDESSNRTNYPYVNITGGNVLHKVVGGGNNANITGNPRILIEGGTIATDATYNTSNDAGVYGGCNTTGIVYGNTSVTLTGGNTTDTNPRLTTVGASNNRVGVFGGGYGQPTEVTGNIMVNFGETIIDDSGDTPVEIATEYPKFYGDLYGGSALGNVNTADNTNPAPTTPTTNTTVNILNGTILGTGTGDTYKYGAVYGGGLGKKAEQGVAAVDAHVYGEVHVNVGSMTPPVAPDTDTIYYGQATLGACDVFGCNNYQGSPTQNVNVDVYQTAHTLDNVASNTAISAPFAIHRVFGGGDEADFTVDGKKTNVMVHQCENTIWRVFGGGNAADVYGVNLRIFGGRYYQVFGGGNGELGNAFGADIGLGGIHLYIGGGHISTLFNGSNEHGEVAQGEGSEGITMTTFNGGCHDAEITDHFMGGNQSDIYDNITETIRCEDASQFKFVNLYCGSNLAQIFGNITLTIEGGEYENVFGGSKGSGVNPNLPPEFQNYSSSIHDNPATDVEEGHVHLILKGGAIGNVFGACDLNGNVDGKVTIDVIDAGNSTCPLFIGNIYGGGKATDYKPINASLQGSNVFSPEINIINGTIGGEYDFSGDGTIQDEEKFAGNVFGGGYEGQVGGGVVNGNTIKSNPKVTIGDATANTTNEATVRGSVFGGGEHGDVDGDTKVILQGKVEIGGDVFGGGSIGIVTGNADVFLGQPSSKTNQEPGTK